MRLSNVHTTHCIMHIEIQNLFFFFCCASFLAASSFLRLSSVRRRSAFSSCVSSTTSWTGVTSFVAFSDGGDDGGPKVGDFVLVRLLLGDVVVARCEGSASTAFPLPPILKCFLVFLGVTGISDCLGDGGTDSLVIRTSSGLGTASRSPRSGGGDGDTLPGLPPIRKPPALGGESGLGDVDSRRKGCEAFGTWR